MRVHGASIGVFWSQLLGYVALSTVVEFVWYHRGRGRESEWRVQGRASGGKRRSHGSGDARERGDSYVWGFPAIDLATGRRVSGRHPLHPAFATANLLVSSLFAGATCEAFLRGASNLVAVPSDEIWSSGALAAHDRHAQTSVSGASVAISSYEIERASLHCYKFTALYFLLTISRG